VTLCKWPLDALDALDDPDTFASVQHQQERNGGQGNVASLGSFHKRMVDVLRGGKGIILS